MITLYYKTMDVLRSWPGRIFLLCAILMWALFSFAESGSESQSKRASSQGKLPKISTSSLWDEAEGDSLETSGKTNHTASQTNLDFRPLILPLEKVEQAPVAEIDRPVVAVAPSQVIEEWVPPSKLILTQRAGEGMTKPVNETQPSQVENGGFDQSLRLRINDLIHCQLLSSLTSELQDSMVLARTTRPLVRKGRVILPGGTYLTGRVQSVTESGRFVFTAEWSIHEQGNKPSFIKATAAEKNLDPISLNPAKSDGMIGLPGSLVSDGKRGGEKSSRMARKALAAVARLGQSRINTVFGEQVPFSVRNTVLEGGRGVLENRLPLVQRPSSRNLRTIDVGQEFYLLIQKSIHE